MIATVAVAYHRGYYDDWTSRHDILAFHLPWFGYLGQRLREFQIPGWNPHLNSGAPFAGDPQSGWMFLPAMITFTLFKNAIVALKVMVGLELLIAGLATYGFARALQLSPPAAAIAAVVFEFGPQLFHSTTCCQVRGQMAPWIPVAFLGIELALQDKPWSRRVLPIFLAGLGMSQFYSSFLGQGSLDGLLLVGAYAGYRGFVNPPNRARAWRDRLVIGSIAGLGSLLFSVTFAAAGLFPRFTFVSKTEIGSGYEGVTDILRGSMPSVKLLLFTLISDRPAERYLSIGGIAFILFIFGVFFSWNRFCVPFFAIFTAISLVMAMGDTPLHQLFYLIPRFKDLHEHYAEQSTVVLMIGPSIVAAAGFDALRTVRRRWWTFLAVLAPLGMLGGMQLWLRSEGLKKDGVTSLAAAAIATAAMLVFLSTRDCGERSRWRRLPGGAAATVVVIAFLLPTGVQMLIPMTSISPGSGWETAIDVDETGSAAAERSVRFVAPGRAGEFLQQQLKIDGPFRYAGYSSYRYGEPFEKWDYDYMIRRTDPNVVGILTNGRAMFLNIYDTQTYNPSQYSRYVLFIQAMNKIDQDYHVSFLNETGIDSKLLPLLNVRYILLDRTIPADRPDAVAIMKDRKVVFQDPRVDVLQSTGAQSTAAWIVHDVRTAPTATVLALMASTDFQPRDAAIVEAPVDGVEPRIAGANEAAVVTEYRPESIGIEATAASNGLLVISEVYDGDWHAYVDGKRVEMLPADYAFRGVAIASGTHDVELRYEPDSLKYGWWLTLASVVVWIAVAIWRGWSRCPEAVRWIRAELDDIASHQMR